MDAPSGNLQGDDNELVTPRVNSGLNLEGNLQCDDNELVTPRVNSGLNLEGNLQGDDNELVNPRVNSGLNLNLEGGKDDIEAQIHLLEQEAYCSVLRAFKAQADSISLGKETLINELRKELRVSSEEQRELLARVDSSTVIRGIRDWRQSGGHQPGMLVAGQSVHDPIPSQGAGPSSTLHPPSVSAANQPSSSLAKRGPLLEPKGKKHKSGQMDEPTFMGVDPNGGDDSVLLDVPGNLCTYRMEGQLINTPQSAPPQSVTPHQSAPPLLPQPAIQVPPAVASLFEQAVFQHIISKRLHHSDVVAGKARFSMPQNQILQQDFLCKSELDLLGKDELKIELFFSGARSYVVDLKLYRSGKSQNRTKVLMGSAWRSLVNDYNLKVGDSVELWKGSKDGTTRYIITKV